MSVKNTRLLGLISAIALLTLATCCSTEAQAAAINNITINGDFSDWASIPAYTDPDGAPGVLHNGIPDTHHTNSDTLGAVPGYRNHPDIDILEYKFTHDENNLYAYFKADGVIGNTATGAQGKGRYYVIVTIDMDNNDSTGYFLHEGGYYPTSGVDRYDMNMELEFYDGQLNTAHYLSHDAIGTSQLSQDFSDLTNGEWPSGFPGPYTPGFAQPAPGTYDEYTQWVYHNNDTLTLVEDEGPIVTGIMTASLSPDGHEIEFAAPFKGFLNNALGNPNMALGKTIDISFSLEASGELAPGNDWASDTGDPITSYFLDSHPGDFNFDGNVDSQDLTDNVDGWEARFGNDLDGGDFLDWQSNFDSGSPLLSEATAIPEPTSASLMVVLTALVLVTQKQVLRRSGPLSEGVG